MEYDGKLFVGGLPWDTNEEKVKDCFQAYGEVVEVVIMKDKNTGRSRGFGFIIFADPSVIVQILQEKHTIDGRMVEVKRAVPREEHQSVQKSSRNSSGLRTKKIFVGGLAPTVTDDDFRQYFEQFGKITDAVVMYDHGTQRPRGFGFISFDSEESVDRVTQKAFHELHEKMVEVKRAIPKEMSQGNTRVQGPGYGVSYAKGHGLSPVRAYGLLPYGRYGQSPVGRGGYPPAYGVTPVYGVVGYGIGMNGGYPAAPGYGYAGGTYVAAGYGSTPVSAGYGSGYGVYGGGSGGYAGGYGGICGSSTYADSYNAPASGSGSAGEASNIGYGMGSLIQGNTNGDSGYDAAFRHSQRAPDGRFRP